MRETDTLKRQASTLQEKWKLINEFRERRWSRKPDRTAAATSLCRYGCKSQMRQRPTQRPRKRTTTQP